VLPSAGVTPSHPCVRRLAVFASALAVLVLSPGSGGAAASSCPRGLLPLEANSIGPAAAAALAHEDPKSRPLVVAALLAAADQDRGPMAKRECGTRVWQRTVVVHIRLRAFLPSASLSERVSFVGRFKGGYRVWQIAH
jgi:hypothetical protein